MTPRTQARLGLEPLLVILVLLLLVGWYAFLLRPSPPPVPELAIHPVVPNETAKTAKVAVKSEEVPVRRAEPARAATLPGRDQPSELASAPLPLTKPTPATEDPVQPGSIWTGVGTQRPVAQRSQYPLELVVVERTGSRFRGLLCRRFPPYAVMHCEGHVHGSRVTFEESLTVRTPARLRSVHLRYEGTLEGDTLEGTWDGTQDGRRYWGTFTFTAAAR